MSENPTVELGKITMQSDNLKHLQGNEYEVISFKRVLQDGTAEKDGTRTKFKIILDARANTMVLTVKDGGLRPGMIARTILFQLRPLATDREVIRLPPRWEAEEETVVCGVSDAMHVSGLLHTLRDLGPFNGAGRPARIYRPTQESE